MRRVAQTFDSTAPLERLSLAPKRGEVAVQFVALGWILAITSKNEQN